MEGREGRRSRRLYASVPQFGMERGGEKGGEEEGVEKNASLSLFPWLVSSEPPSPSSSKLVEFSPFPFKKISC